MKRALTYIAVLLAPAAFAQEILYHGAPLNEQFRVQLAQEHRSIKIGTVQRTRVVGKQEIEPLGSLNTVGVSQRRTPKPRYFCEVRVQILQSSGPNYLENPGQRYRIEIRSLEAGFDYGNVVEVFAAQARDTVFYELEKLRQQLSGIEKEALAIAAPLTVNAFKASQLLPAEIFESVMRSRGGRFRITEDTLQVRRIAPTELFAPSTMIDRPRLGATIRAEERKELPRGAAGQPFARGFQPTKIDIGQPAPPSAPGIPTEGDDQRKQAEERRSVSIPVLRGGRP